MVNFSNFDFRNFLTFHVKKGVEGTGSAKIIALRTSTLEHMKEINKSLLVTVEGEEGVMYLSSDTIDSKVLSTTKIIYGRGVKYGLIRVFWFPTDENTLLILDKLQTMERNFLEDIEVTFKLVQKKI